VASQPIHATKHPKHSRILDQRNIERAELTGKIIAASKKAIQRAHELIDESERAITAGHRRARTQ
jgi:hypothetical protein